MFCQLAPSEMHLFNIVDDLIGIDYKRINILNDLDMIFGENQSFVFTLFTSVFDILSSEVLRIKLFAKILVRFSEDTAILPYIQTCKKATEAFYFQNKIIYQFSE